MLTNFTKKILKDYKSVRDKKEKFEGHTMAKLIKEDFPEYLKKITPNSSEYKFVGNAGKNTGAINWTLCPTIAVLNSKITKKLSEGFFVIFIYSIETNRVYLSLTYNIRKWSRRILTEKAENYREKLSFNEKFRIKELSLGDNYYYRRYQYANIYAKCYNLDNLPSEKELVSDYHEILDLYNQLIDIEIGSGKEPVKKSFGTPSLPSTSIRNSLEDLLKNYKPAMNDLLSKEEKNRIKDVLGTQLPDYLNEITENHYDMFSSASDKFHFCPYIALMNTKVTRKHTAGIFVNYIFREDMSGVYLALRQGIDDISKGDTYLNQLESKSKDYRAKIDFLELTKQFSENIDLKGKNADYAPFYEAGNIYSKFYEKDDIPSEEELIEDLNNILKIYDEIAENEFLKFLKEIYAPEIHIAKCELERGKNVIFYGPPGSGKTVLSKIVSANYLENDGYKLYTVHSGTDYFDLVCRIVPEINDDGNLIYSKERRFLLDALLSGKVLILDEINRTQIDTALGIFFTYLERDHRLNDVNQIKEILKREINEDIGFDDLKQKLSDFRIIGTLNVYDKTFLFKLGDALKRRFTFIEITTNPELLNDIINHPEIKNKFIRICNYDGDIEVSDTLINVFADLNHIKPLGIGILKEVLQFSLYFPKNEAADTSVSSLIVPFFENDLNYSKIRNILENHDLSFSKKKLESLNFGISDNNGIY